MNSLSPGQKDTQPIQMEIGEIDQKRLRKKKSYNQRKVHEKKKKKKDLGYGSKWKQEKIVNAIVREEAGLAFVLGWIEEKEVFTQFGRNKKNIETKGKNDMIVCGDNRMRTE